MSREVHQWKPNIKYTVKFLYDTPFEDDGKFGKYWSYGVQVDDVEKTIQASKTLSEMLENYKTDDVVYVKKSVSGNGDFNEWVISEKDVNEKVEKTAEKAAEYVDTKRGELTQERELSYEEKEEEKWKAINWRNRREIAWGQAMNLGINTINLIDPQLAEKDTEQWMTRSVALAAKVYPSLLKKEDELQFLYENGMTIELTDREESNGVPF